ncbi:MAG: MFS transporter [Candidatus Tectomicrobia bacterium]|nr:MFS transporter [Candidatus Tectomicrobia bacterium]
MSDTVDENSCDDHWTTSADPTVSSRETQKALKNSIIEGGFSSALVTLTGGVFLTGFALLLGANSLQIGLIAAFPHLANLLQLVGSYIIERTGARQRFCILTSLLGRPLWMIIALLPFISLPFIEDRKVSIFLLLLALINFFASLHGVSWLSWIASIVPTEIRGRYFGKRTMVMSAASMALGFAGGQFLDQWNQAHPENIQLGFAVIFGFGVICGLISTVYYWLIPEPEIPESQRHETFKSLMKLPLQDHRYKKLLLYQIYWQIAMGFAGPFFSVYMLQLNLSYTFIALMNVVSSLASISAMKWWGEVADRYGNKPILTLILVGKGIFPLLWLFTHPTSYTLFVIVHLMSVLDGGMGLCSSNLLLRVTPDEHRSIFLAFSAAVVGIGGVFAPTVGGALATALKDVHFTLGPIVLEQFKFLFLLSGILRFGSIYFMRRVEEPDAKSLSTIMNLFPHIRKLSISEEFHQTLHHWIEAVRHRESVSGQSDKQR